MASFLPVPLNPSHHKPRHRNEEETVLGKIARTPCPPLHLQWVAEAECKRRLPGWRATEDSRADAGGNACSPARGRIRAHLGKYGAGSPLSSKQLKL